MTFEDLLTIGYFPKELPPPFNTELFGSRIEDIKKEWGKLNKGITKPFYETTPIHYHFPKVSYSRRVLTIPNPIPFIETADLVITHWKSIKSIISKSKLSTSTPVKGISRAFKPELVFEEFIEKCNEISYDSAYELKIDISKFYQSIYTHSIPWAIHGKAKAKKRRIDDKLYGNNIDKSIRRAQGGQTIGIPIGPDTSFIIAELICSRIDYFLQKARPKIKGLRYYDDYTLYFKTLQDAEETLKIVQKLFLDFNLDINEDKTKIQKNSSSYESPWSISLSNFRIRETIKGQKEDIFNFISLAFYLANKNPKDSVLKFTIKKLFYHQIKPENWNFVESLFLKISLAEPATLPDLAKILITYKTKVSKTKLKEFLVFVINDHSTKNHSFEVSWALWISIAFGIKLPKSTCDSVLNSLDPICLILLLDLNKSGLISGKLKISIVRNEMDELSLKDENWLLTYEAMYNNWVKPKDPQILKKSGYFGSLQKLKINFYDNTRTLTPIDFNIKRRELFQDRLLQLKYSMKKTDDQADGRGTKKEGVIKYE